MRTLRCIESSGFDHRLTRCHMREEHNPLIHSCENLNTGNVYVRKLCYTDKKLFTSFKTHRAGIYRTNLLSTHYLYNYCTNLLSTHYLHIYCTNLLSTHYLYIYCTNLLSTHYIYIYCTDLLSTHYLYIYCTNLFSTHYLYIYCINLLSTRSLHIPVYCSNVNKAANVCIT
jgi:hypothetical protein